MIYLNKTTETQRVMIPRTIRGEGAYRLVIISTDTHQVAFEGPVEPTSYRLYEEVSLQFTTEPDYGTYEYLLMQGLSEVARGVARVGDMWLNTEYEHDTQFKQYE